MWLSSVFGPTIQVIVPPVRSPAILSITGASAEIITCGGSGVGTEACAFTRNISPLNETIPSVRSGWRTLRYSRMCTAGRSYESPHIISTTGACEGPSPRVKRPPVAACTVSACCAMIVGWRTYVGTMDVPNWIRLVLSPAIAITVITSAPKIWPYQMPSKPSFSASTAAWTWFSISGEPP